jgi:hypothetical protein
VEILPLQESCEKFWTTSKYIYAVNTRERKLVVLEIDVNCLEECQFCIIAVFKWIA